MVRKSERFLDLESFAALRMTRKITWHLKDTDDEVEEKRNELSEKLRKAFYSPRNKCWFVNLGYKQGMRRATKKEIEAALRKKLSV